MQGFAGYNSWFVNLRSGRNFVFNSIEAFEGMLLFIQYKANLNHTGMLPKGWLKLCMRTVWEWIEIVWRKQVKRGSVMSFVGKVWPFMTFWRKSLCYSSLLIFMFLLGLFFGCEDLLAFIPGLSILGVNESFSTSILSLLIWWWHLSSITRIYMMPLERELP